MKPFVITASIFYAFVLLAKAAEPPGVGPFTSRPPYQNAHIAAFAKRNKADRQTVVFLGDSITEGWKGLGRAFPKLRIANRGIASDTTRGMLCRLRTTVLALQPRAIVILGGINDLRAANRPPGTPETIATNLGMILKEIQKYDPKLPVLVCEIMPSVSAAPAIIAQANQAVDRVVAGFPQAIRVRTHSKFLNADGTQNKKLFTDGVHLTADGYAAWFSALDPELGKLTPVRINRAVIPATQPGTAYNWMSRHNEILKIKQKVNPDLVFIGDSITHHWGGTPPSARYKNGEKVLMKAFVGHRILNLGYGSDRTQNVLWRLDHGELQGLKPKWVVVNIGTNNTSDRQTAEDIMEGIVAVCERVKKQTPDAKLILMSIFPRDPKAGCPRRKLIDDLNRRIADYAQKMGFVNCDIGGKFLDKNGAIMRNLMPDYCHPVAAGYQYWADALRPLLK